jgi:hypothetical protein
MGKFGHLTVEEIKEITEEKEFECLIETGTYLADSTIEASKCFDTVYTIEIVDKLYDQAKERCKDITNIVFHLGDTIKLLPDIINKVYGLNCVWFLDAHQSGPDTSNNGKWVPLLDELNIILRNFDRSKYHIFIIDDVRLFSAHWDWSGISVSSIEQQFKNYNINVIYSKLMNDRFILYV